MTVIYPETPGDGSGPRLRLTLDMFLTARYDEAEAAATRARDAEPTYPHFGDTAVEELAVLAASEGANLDARDYVLRFDPAYVLADIAAKRKIVDLATNQHTRCVEYDELLPILALPFSEHPDFREEWRP